MDDNLKLLYEYMLRAMSILSLESWLITFMGCLMIGMYAYFHSTTYGDWVVGKKRKRAKHRALLDKAQQKITETFEAQVRQGQMLREDVDKLYAIMRKGCSEFKELGPEPTFGKPWYKGPALSESAAKVKKQILDRLVRSGKTVHEIWTAKKRISLANAMGRKSAQQDMADLMKAIKSKSK